MGIVELMPTHHRLRQIQRGSMVAVEVVAVAALVVAVVLVAGGDSGGGG